MTSRRERVSTWVRLHKKQLFVWLPLGLVGVTVLLQLLYPTGRLLPWQQIDGQFLGGWTKTDAEKNLDKKYRDAKYSVYFGNAEKPQYTPRLAEVGTTATNGNRLEEMGYAWYLRIVPTSLLWAHTVVDTGEPVYARDAEKLAHYMTKELGGSCEVAPLNATAKVTQGKVVAVESVNGGTCNDVDVKRTLQTIEPRLDSAMKSRIAMEEIAAPLTTDKIQPTIDTLNTQLAQPIPITYDGKTEQLAAKTVRSWLKFRSDDTQLIVAYDDQKASEYLSATYGKTLAKPAGVSKVRTHDFVEVARQDGANGRALDVGQTLAHLSVYLAAEADTVPLGETAIAPKVEYTRTYSNTDTGLSALMKNYAEGHPGVYGVSMIELDGKRRRAAYQDDRKFTTASTYKLYVGYSTLRRVESGEFKWSDQIQGGRDLAKCFDDMIVKSDNACAEALVAKIGYRPLTTDAQSIVSANTTFLDTESYKTTAGDLSTFMASLATGQLPLNAESKTRFLDALKRNQYRQGIPAGATGQVADKVGFLDGLLHDAAIVYSSSGTYALSIMTDKSSWGNIAELTREIEKLKNQ